MDQPKPNRNEWSPPPIPFPPRITTDDIRAIQHVMAYAAETESVPPSPAECKQAMDWIIYEACKHYDVPFFSDDVNGRNDAFMSGRSYVAKKIITMMQLKPANFESKDKR
jgi:hypothetical protein